MFFIRELGIAFAIDIVFAFILDCILGDPYGFPHPVRFIGKYIGSFEKLIRKRHKSDAALRYVFGPLLTVTTVSVTFFICYFILKLAWRTNIYMFHLLDIILLWTAIAPCCLAKEAVKIYKPLESGDIGMARDRIKYLVSRDTNSLDKEGIIKATVETVLENTSDGVIAPLFYMFIGGAPLALAYKAVNTLDSMVGYRNEKYENFGFFSAKVDDLVNFIPARISGFLIIVGAFILNYDYKSSAKIFFRDRLNHKSPNSAHTEAAGAGALGIRLGGDGFYFGKVVKKPYIGDHKRGLVTEDIIGAIELMYSAAVVFILLFISIGLYI